MRSPWLTIVIHMVERIAPLPVKALMRYGFVYLAIFAACVLALGRPVDPPATGGLRPGDQLRIRPVTVDHGFAPLFQLDLTVDAEGRIALPAFDLELDVHALQPEDAEVLIRSALREASDLIRLDLTILATRDGLPLSGQHCVSVGGSVHQPGPVALKPGMTLAQAIDAVGGATPRGNLKHVRVYREGSVTSYDLTNPAHANGSLARNDMIDVPARTWIGR
jgi:protein involved in polysaccharide export with SLBB domain